LEEVAERLNAPVLKTDVVKAIEGSNPSLSVFIQSVPELKGANGQINVHAIARNQRSEAAVLPQRGVF
jgi:hypothetical protein